MKILHLTLEKKWFDMIASGKKRHEYRELKTYWITRFHGKTFDAVEFRNGYKKDSPRLTVKLLEIIIGYGLEDWGAPKNQTVYVLRLGKILEGERTK